MTEPEGLPPFEHSGRIRQMTEWERIPPFGRSAGTRQMTEVESQPFVVVVTESLAHARWVLHIQGTIFRCLQGGSHNYCKFFS